MARGFENLTLVAVAATRSSHRGGRSASWLVTVEHGPPGRRRQVRLWLSPHLPVVGPPDGLYALALAAWDRNEAEASFVLDVLRP